MLYIKQATIEDLKDLTPLFSAYRVFYKQEAAPKSEFKFLLNRLNHNESIIFIAYYQNKAVAFTQLYPTFSSVSLQPFYILNDLFVVASHRNLGIAKALLNHAKQYCIDKNYKGLALETASDNFAQKLYEKLGWEKDSTMLHYFWKAPQ